MTTTSPDALDTSEAWVVLDGAFATDGGSICLRVRTPPGATRGIVLWQHLFTEVNDPARIPGRLYIDGALVPVRSELERTLIEALRGASLEVPAGGRADGGGARGSSPGMIVGRDIEQYYSKIDEGPAAALAHLVEQLIAYVESEDYVELARRLAP